MIIVMRAFREAFFAVRLPGERAAARRALGLPENRALAVFVYLEFCRRPAEGESVAFVGRRHWMVLAFFLGKGLRIVLFHVNTFDPMMFVSISAMLIVVGLLLVLLS